MPTEPTPEATLDPEAVERFAGDLLTTFTAGMTTLMIDLADRTGLLDALARGRAPAPSWPRGAG